MFRSLTIDTISEFKSAIIVNGGLKKVGGNIFENDEFNRIFNEIEMSLASCQRVEQKSIGNILRIHKEIEN